MRNKRIIIAAFLALSILLAMLLAACSQSGPSGKR